MGEKKTGPATEIIVAIIAAIAICLGAVIGLWQPIVARLVDIFIPIPTPSLSTPSVFETPISRFTNSPPTQAIQPIITSPSNPSVTVTESPNWAVTFEYRIPLEYWSAGLHKYTLTATCPGEDTGKITNSFTVSDNFAIKDGDVYLRYIGLRLSKTYNAEAVEGINTKQSTVAVVTYDQITKTEAEWRAINCFGTVSWDGGTPVPLIAQTPFQH